jgi:hypothetical protein
MSRFRKPVKSQTGYLEGPELFTATWNAGRGAFSFTIGKAGTPDRKQGDIKDIKGIVLESAPYTVTGKEKGNKGWLSANICFPYLEDDLKLKYIWPEGDKYKHELIFDGTYATLRTNGIKSIYPKPRFTKVVYVLLLSGKQSIYDPDKGKSSKFEEFSYLANLSEAPIVALYLRGNSIKLGFNDGLKTSAPGINPGEAGGLAFHQDASKDIQVDNDGKIWLHPFFEFTEVGGEDIIKLAGEKFAVVKEYFEVLYSSKDGLGEDKSEDNVAKEYPATDEDEEYSEFKAPEEGITRSKKIF